MISRQRDAPRPQTGARLSKSQKYKTRHLTALDKAAIAYEHSLPQAPPIAYDKYLPQAPRRPKRKAKR